MLDLEAPAEALRQSKKFVANAQAIRDA